MYKVTVWVFALGATIAACRGGEDYKATNRCASSDSRDECRACCGGKYTFQDTLVEGSYCHCFK